MCKEHDIPESAIKLYPNKVSIDELNEMFVKGWNANNEDISDVEEIDFSSNVGRILESQVTPVVK